MKKIDLLEKKLNIKEKKEKAKKLQKESSQPDFWKDPQSASKKMVELADLQREIKEIEDLRGYYRLGEKEKFEEALKKLEMRTFLSGQYDRSGAILSLHAGQGGTEAMDWAEMLKRMYVRFIEKQNWSWKLVEETRGEEAGIKSSTIMVAGTHAYGFLKHEAGTHRLVRLSPFNADHLRQTSFALVETLPIIKEAEVDLKDEEIEFEAFRSSGPGGQFVQKVATAVRLRHKPTGIVVESQAERSQIQNRKIAKQILTSKLWDREQEKRKKEIKKIKGEYKAASWGNQIRSYVLHPYHLVKDLRTGYETSDTDAVLDGELEKFIEAAIYKLL